MSDNATRFGRDAANYKAARPTYPDALYDWIRSEAPSGDLVWDAGGDPPLEWEMITPVGITRARELVRGVSVGYSRNTR